MQIFVKDVLRCKCELFRLVFRIQVYNFGQILHAEFELGCALYLRIVDSSVQERTSHCLFRASTFPLFAEGHEVIIGLRGLEMTIVSQK